MRSYKDLVVWQRAMSLAEAVYRLARKLPTSERYGLTVQLQRSAVSIPSNIAEGHPRNSTREYLRFLSIAQGPLAELETQLLLARRLGYFAESELLEPLDLAAEVGRMLNGLQSRLSDKFLSDPPGPRSLAPGPSSPTSTKAKRQ